MTGVMVEGRSGAPRAASVAAMTAVHAPATAPPGPAAPHRLAVSGRAAVLLDVLMGFSVVSDLTSVASMAAGPPPASWTAGYLLLVLTMVAPWGSRRVLERRSGRPARRLVVAFAILGLLGLFVSNGQGSYPLFVMALLAVVLSFSPRTGLSLVLALLVVRVAAQLAALLATGQGLSGSLRWWPTPPTSSASPWC